MRVSGSFLPTYAANPISLHHLVLYYLTLSITNNMTFWSRSRRIAKLSPFSKIAQDPVGSHRVLSIHAIWCNVTSLRTRSSYLRQ